MEAGRWMEAGGSNDTRYTMEVDEEPFDRFHDRREEERRRTGFLYDMGLQRQREKTFNEYGERGSVEYRPGFNPPRRVSRTDYEDIPIEVRDMILDRMGNFKERTRTRMISRSHAAITKTLDEVLDEAIGDALKGVTLSSCMELIPSERYEEGEARVWMHAILYRVYDTMFTKLSIPLIVEPSMEDISTTSITIACGNLVDPILRDYEHELLFTCYTYDDSMDLNVNYCRVSTEIENSKELWDNYPIIRKIVKRISERVRFIKNLVLEDSDEACVRFKRDMLKRRQS